MHTQRDAKAMAKSLRQYLSEQHVDITHAVSLECVARQLGWRDWNTLAARLDHAPPRRPKGWTISGSHSQDYDMGLDEAEGCALIRYRHAVLPDRDSGFGTLMQSIRAEAYLGKRLRLSAQLRTREVSGAATLWLRVDVGKGRTVAFDNMETRERHGPLAGTVDWQDRSIVLDVPDDAMTVNFGFYLRGSGSAWARGFRLDEVDASVPVTTDVVPSRSAPTNLDFADVA